LAAYLSPGRAITVWGDEMLVDASQVIDISHLAFKE
jgi:hypothetical protein